MESREIGTLWMRKVIHSELRILDLGHYLAAVPSANAWLAKAQRDAGERRRNAPYTTSYSDSRVISANRQVPPSSQRSKPAPPSSHPPHTSLFSHNNPVSPHTLSLNFPTPCLTALLHFFRQTRPGSASPASLNLRSRSSSSRRRTTARASSNRARTSSEARAREEGRGSKG